MRTKLLIAAVLLALAGQAGAKGASCTPSAPLRAMTYNIRLDTPADGENRWERRRALLVSQIRLVRPAVLGMQEVLPGQRADLEAALPGYLRMGGGRDDGKDAGEASPLFVDRAAFAVQASGTFWLSPTPDRPSKGWGAAYPRIASWAHLRRRQDGLRLLAINTHWDHIGAQARAESARQIAGWIAGNKASGEALVLLGDFNAPLDEPSLRWLTGANGPGTGLVDSRAAAGVNAAAGTNSFNGFDPLPRSGGVIDHILVESGASVPLYHLLAAHFDGHVASDHFAVIADLTFACRKAGSR